MRTVLKGPLPGFHKRFERVVMSAETPPQSTVCSPKRSVLVSSLKVLPTTPAFSEPMPLA
jgi:hypothetical protein